MVCSICFEEVSDGSYKPHNNQDHVYHIDCIKAWILNSSNYLRQDCPICMLPMENLEDLMAGESDEMILKVLGKDVSLALVKDVLNGNIFAGRFPSKELYETLWSVLGASELKA